MQALDKTTAMRFSHKKSKFKYFAKPFVTKSNRYEWQRNPILIQLNQMTSTKPEVLLMFSRICISMRASFENITRATN